MSNTDLVVAPIAADLVLALASEFNAVDDADNLDRRPVCLRPGDRTDLLVSTTQDECCAGLIWVRLIGLWPSTQRFPSPDSAVEPCDVRRYAVQFELGAARCAPTGDGQTIPTCDQWTDTTLATYEDAAALRRGVLRYRADHIDTLVSQGDEMSLSVEGGCVGTALVVTIAGDACDRVTAA